jgi:GNAT superfamily N-acetyltransferase
VTRVTLNLLIRIFTSGHPDDGHSFLYRTLVPIPLKEYNPSHMGRNAADPDAFLLAAAAANHRQWFRARGEPMGIWSLGRNDALGVRLVARGYELGWRPHWMGVDLEAEPKVQGRGIGLALTNAALRAAWERGCRAAVLNATPAGERLYARAGFRSLGRGQTWWPSGDPAPTERQIAITEAIGFGAVEAMEGLGPG